jgi:hypothetical protein
MTEKRVLIVGDSFSSEQLSGDLGWPVLLKQDFTVTNLSSPGIGQYKILKKLQSVDLDDYDFVVISHTSPNRIHCESNPLYPDNHLYRSSDIIFADAESKLNQVAIAQDIVSYYKHIFDLDYYKFIHSSCCREIDQITQHSKVLHITHFDWADLYQFDCMINFYKFWLDNRGDVVHYTKQANQTIYKQLQLKLQELSQ